MNNQRKIPYDASPISREVTSHRQTPARKNFAQMLFIASIFIFNIVIGSLFIYYIYNNNNNNSVIINNQIISNTTVSAVAASKAKLSSVCIGAGGQDDSKVRFSKENVPDYSELFTRTSSKGSGVIIQINKQLGEAYILTCNHVVSNYDSSLFVLLYDSYKPVHATLVGRSTKYDLAVLKIEDDQIKESVSVATTVANSSLVAEGDEAIAVGNPQSNGFAVTVGHVSRTNVLASSAGVVIRSLQVDTPINSGNSGGGLFDQNGNLIGIVQSKNTNSGIDNVATAIHSNTAISIANNLIDGRNLQYADLGVSLAIKDVEIQQSNGKVYRTDKVCIASVSDNSDARGKLFAGDQIVAFTYNGKTVQVINEYCFEEIKFDLQLGDVVEFSVIRNGSVTQNTIKVEITKLTSGL